MAKFLNGIRLTKKIEKISAGKDKRFAVAFWGDGAFDFLFPDGKAKGARVICDLSMGATNPAEIKELQKHGAKVRHIESFHGKVYLSDKGVVVASANVSRNALGFENAAKHVETGVFHGANSGVYREAEGWFDEIWKQAAVVEDNALKDAQIAWNRRDFAREAAHRSKDIAKGKSLLWALEHKPDVFGDIQFVITHEDADKEDKDQGVKALDSQSIDDSPIDGEEIKTRSNIKYSYYTGFNLKPNKWPRIFFGIYIGPKGGVQVSRCARHEVISFKGLNGEERHLHRALCVDESDERFHPVKGVDLNGKEAKRDIWKALATLKDEDQIFSAEKLHKRLFNDKPVET